MSRAALSMIVALILNLFCSAEKNQQTETPVFTSGTDFVEVPVLVQKSGKHVSGLKKEDFVLRQDGKVVEPVIAGTEDIHDREPQDHRDRDVDETDAHQFRALLEGEAGFDERIENGEQDQRNGQRFEDLDE